MSRFFISFFGIVSLSFVFGTNTVFAAVADKEISLRLGAEMNDCPKWGACFIPDPKMEEIQILLKGSKRSRSGVHFHSIEKEGVKYRVKVTVFEDVYLSYSKKRYSIRLTVFSTNVHMGASSSMYFQYDDLDRFPEISYRAPAVIRGNDTSIFPMILLAPRL